MRSEALLPFGLSAALGLCSVVVLGALTGGKKEPPQSQHPQSLLEAGFDSPLAVLFLFVSGMIVGFLYPKRAWRWGLGTMVLFPIAIIIEGTLVPGTHNLLPFELVFCGIATIPGILGAVAGSFVKGRFRGAR